MTAGAADLGCPRQHVVVLKALPAYAEPPTGQTMSLHQFLRPSPKTFDEAATQDMGDAFDWVCAGLKLDDPMRAKVARCIIEAAERGERDAAKLREAGLTATRS